MFGFWLGFAFGVATVMVLTGSRMRVPQLRNVDRGWEVFTADDQRIGHVDEVHRDEIVIWQAGPRGEDYRIPAAAVADASLGHVKLSLTHDQLRQRFPTGPARRGRRVA